MHIAGNARVSQCPTATWPAAARLVRRIPDRAMLDPEAACAAPARLFTFTLPGHLDGSAGTNRAPGPAEEVPADDLALLEDYLADFPYQPAAYRWHRRELERFLLWLLFERTTPLSSATATDCRDYLRFLRRPHGQLTGPRTRRKGAPWSPFSEEPEGATERQRAASVLRAAFTAFVRVRYLANNPWEFSTTGRAALAFAPEGGSAAPVSMSKAAPTWPLRELDPDIWEAVIACLEEGAAEGDGRALRTALAGLWLLGDGRLRRDQAATAVIPDLKGGDGDNAALLIRRGGRGPGRVPIPLGARTVAALHAHWADRGDAATDHAAGLAAPILLLPMFTTRVPRLPRGRLALRAADELYELLAHALRSQYARLESRLGVRTPTIHGFLQHLEILAEQR